MSGPFDFNPIYTVYIVSLTLTLNVYMYYLFPYHVQRSPDVVCSMHASRSHSQPAERRYQPALQLPRFFVVVAAECAGILEDGAQREEHPAG